GACLGSLLRRHRRDLLARFHRHRGRQPSSYPERALPGIGRRRMGLGIGDLAARQVGVGVEITLDGCGATQTTGPPGTIAGWRRSGSERARRLATLRGHLGVAKSSSRRSSPYRDAACPARRAPWAGSTPVRMEGIVTPQQIFLVSVIFGLLVWGLLAWQYIWP